MKNQFTLTTIITGGLIWGAYASADTVTIRADEWFPFNGEPGAPRLGFMIDIAKAAFARRGHQVDYQTMPWERAIESVREGKYDCIVGAYVEDAPDFLFPTEEQGVDSTHFFMTAGKKWDYSIQKLANQRLAVISGYSYDSGGEIDAYIEAHANSPQVQVATGNNALDKLIKMLLNDRVDLVLESPLVMKAKLHELGLTDKIVPVARLGEEIPVYVACSPAQPNRQKYVDILSTEMPHLRKNGELAKILDKYGLQDWK